MAGFGERVKNGVVVVLIGGGVLLVSGVIAWCFVAFLSWWVFQGGAAVVVQWLGDHQAVVFVVAAFVVLIVLFLMGFTYTASDQEKKGIADVADC